eukprot:Mycagemm_TRINITY_DN10283_c0_g4::TRINITY_DN10283_c0_g4_i1::g.3903::m.3903 type:complete len:145 gc:universal TRINITY_DN10283_c0_g4_i1:2-436(+)
MNASCSNDVATLKRVDPREAQWPTVPNRLTKVQQLVDLVSARGFAKVVAPPDIEVDRQLIEPRQVLRHELRQLCEYAYAAQELPHLCQLLDLALHDGNDSRCPQVGNQHLVCHSCKTKWHQLCHHTALCALKVLVFRVRWLESY